MNRFDFEQQILKCWNVTDDIKDVCEMVAEKGASQDDVLNALIGIQTIYNSRFDSLFRMFEENLRKHKNPIGC